MKAEIDAAIKAIVDDIAERQEALKALRKLGGYDTAPMNQPIPPAPAPTARGLKPLDVRNKKTAGKRGPYKKRTAQAEQQIRPAKTAPLPAASGVVYTPAPAPFLDKPKTIGGAMKAAIRNQTRFTGEALRNLLLQDEDIRELIEEASPGAVAGNLTYWAERGYLTRDGEKPLEATYTVTSAGKEWFSR